MTKPKKPVRQARCLQPGPLTEDGCTTSCVLPRFHASKHEWTRDDEAFIPAQQKRKSEPHAGRQ
jgi:hypothetical protein